MNPQKFENVNMLDTLWRVMAQNTAFYQSDFRFDKDMIWKWHDVSVYVADQYFDSVNRTEEMEQTRFEMSIRPLETNAGTVATASAADASGSYSACRYAVYKAGNKVVDIDQFNQIHMVNGKDCAADVRKCLGLM